MKFSYKFTPYNNKLYTGLTIILCFCVVFNLTFFLAVRQVQGAEGLSSPTIVINPDIYYPMDEILYLEGRAEPNFTVQINFQKAGAKPINLNTKSDANGEWVLTEKVPLEAGNWEVRARLILSSGATSDWSNPRVIKAIETGFVIGGFTVKYAFLLFLFLVILTIGIILIFYFSSRAKHYRQRLTSLRVKELQKELAEKERELEKTLLDKEKEEAKTILEKSFVDLKNAIMQELEQLQMADKKLTPEEIEHRERLLNQLKDAEEKIESKIKSIDKND